MWGIRTDLLAGAAFCALFSAPAAAFGLDTINPLSANFSGLSVTLGGQASAAGFSADQPSATGLDQSGASGAATATLNVERDYDSGLSLSLKSAFEVYHDRLSGDNYGSDLVQKVYGVAQTGLGRVEVGMTDGAAYALAVTGPVVDDATTLDNPNVTFFRDPTSGATFELSNLYDHAWLNGSNEYVMSDDPNFNPNGNLTGDWTALQLVRQEP